MEGWGGGGIDGYTGEKEEHRWMLQRRMTMDGWIDTFGRRKTDASVAWGRATCSGGRWGLGT